MWQSPGGRSTSGDRGYRNRCSVCPAALNRACKWLPLRYFNSTDRQWRQRARNFVDAQQVRISAERGSFTSLRSLYSSSRWFHSALPDRGGTQEVRRDVFQSLSTNSTDAYS